MCAVFLIPMILRPLDFLLNVRNYILGLASYIFMMPTFINIMQIYAMCNLHDISWGNRPSTQGVEAVTMNQKAQEILKEDYKVFRAYFLYFWLLSNALFGGLTVALNNTGYVKFLNKYFTFLDGFALFVAGLIIFKFLFSLIYTLKWNIRRWVDPYYGNPPFSLNDEFKKIRKNRSNAGFSTDEDEDNEDDEEAGAGDESFGEEKKMFREKTNGSIAIKDNPEIDDSDNDDMDFDNADKEE